MSGPVRSRCNVCLEDRMSTNRTFLSISLFLPVSEITCYFASSQQQTNNIVYNNKIMAITYTHVGSDLLFSLSFFAFLIMLQWISVSHTVSLHFHTSILTLYTQQCYYLHIYKLCIWGVCSWVTHHLTLNVAFEKLDRQCPLNQGAANAAYCL